jgi:site-specific recombinase XerD
LEKYFVKPKTVDRIRASWIGPEVERYVVWLDEHGYAARVVHARVPLIVAFGEFARVHGANTVADLPAHVEAFVSERVAERGCNHRQVPRPEMGKEIRRPIESFLEVVVADYRGRGRRRFADPFSKAVPGFFDYLADERGLRPASINSYRFYLDRFQAYLHRIGVVELSELSPLILSSFVAERCAQGLAKTTVREGCGVLRVFLRFAHRQGHLLRDLSDVVEWPQAYRLSSVPRSISWAEVAKVLAGVDRRTPCGKRDYAILLLLVSYGLRSREIAALSLDDIDWKRERLSIPERKAGHHTAFPLSAAVGEALVDYLRHGRPETTAREVFLRAVAPVRPLGPDAVSSCARAHLLAAGVQAPRLGSHTLRHTAVQRLVDADFSLKDIGDFVGHASPASTGIYAKVAVESLRQVALGDGEEVLS